MNTGWVLFFAPLIGVSVAALLYMLIRCPWMDRGGKPQWRPWTAGDHEACDVPGDEADQFARFAARYPNLGKEVER